MSVAYGFEAGIKPAIQNAVIVSSSASLTPLALCFLHPLHALRMGIDGIDELNCSIAHLAARLFQKAEAADPIGWRHDTDVFVKGSDPIDGFAVEPFKASDEIALDMRFRLSLHDTTSPSAPKIRAWV
jgi:hypothetical protein